MYNNLIFFGRFGHYSWPFFMRLSAVATFLYVLLRSHTVKKGKHPAFSSKVTVLEVAEIFTSYFMNTIFMNTVKYIKFGKK